LASSFITIAETGRGIVGSIVSGAGGRTARCAWTIDRMSVSRNGSRPVSSSNSVTPNA